MPKQTADVKQTMAPTPIFFNFHLQTTMGDSSFQNSVASPETVEAPGCLYADQRVTPVHLTAYRAVPPPVPDGKNTESEDDAIHVRTHDHDS
jgi:hypothetical protein